VAKSCASDEERGTTHVCELHRCALRDLGGVRRLLRQGLLLRQSPV